MGNTEEEKKVIPKGEVPKEEPKTPTAREAFYGRVREAYPDDEIGDEAVYEKAGELLAGLQDYKGNREGVDAKLREIFEADPKLGAVFAELVEGKKPFRAILAGHYNPDELVPQEGDDDFEAYSGTLAERKKQLEEQQKQQAKMLENMENAEKVFEAFAQEKGFDETAKKEFSDKIQTVLQDMADGVLTPETLLLFFKGLNYDQDKADAEKLAEVKGRNAKIQETVQKTPQGDGLPDTSKASKEPMKEERKPQTIDRMVGSQRKIL